MSIFLIGYIPHLVSTGLNYPHGLGTGDMNGDGIVDVVASAAYGDQIAWFEHDGFWGFIQHMVGSCAAPLYLDVGDLDGDEALDIVAGDYTGTEIYLFYNSGDGSSFTQQTLSAPGDVWEIDIGDIDADGDQDIAATTGGGVVWFRNDGSSFAQLPVGSISWPHGCRLFDLDGDGHLEVAATDPFTVFKNEGSESFVVFYQDASLQESWGVGTYDIDGDGDIDFAVNDYAGGAVYVYWREALGFTKQIVGTVGEAEGLDAGNINAEAGGDIAVAAASGWVECYYYTGTDFMLEIVAPLYDADLVLISDVNGDNCPDLVASGPYADSLMVYENTGCAFGCEASPARRGFDLKVLYQGTGPLILVSGYRGREPLEIYDPTGRLVAHRALVEGDNRVRFPNLPPGLYVARIRGLSQRPFFVP